MIHIKQLGACVLRFGGGVGERCITEAVLSALGNKAQKRLRYVSHHSAASKAADEAVSALLSWQAALQAAR